MFAGRSPRKYDSKKLRIKKPSAEDYPDRNPLQTQRRSKENTKRRKKRETPKTVLEKNYACRLNSFACKLGIK